MSQTDLSRFVLSKPALNWHDFTWYVNQLFSIGNNNDNVAIDDSQNIRLLVYISFSIYYNGIHLTKNVKVNKIKWVV